MGRYNENPAGVTKNSLKAEIKGLCFPAKQHRKHIFSQGIITAFPKSFN